MVANINGLYFARWYGLTVPGVGELAACMYLMLKRRALCAVIEDVLVVHGCPTFCYASLCSQVKSCDKASLSCYLFL